MNKLALATLAAMGIGVLAACDESGPRSTQPQDAQLQFDAADKNGDGVITLQEGLDTPGLDFRAVDIDNSQTVTRQEFATAMALSRQRG